MGFKETALYRFVLSAIAHPRNFAFCAKYPFWKSRNVWNGKFLGYDSTMYDWIPDGWRKAFGKQLTEEIADALKKDGIKRSKWSKMVLFQDIKEKYGTLRLHAFAPQSVQNVFDKYECMSYGYCIDCGKPARYMTRGYITLLCEECAHKLSSGKYHHESDRLTKSDLPVYYSYDGGKKAEMSAMDKYGIDLEALWGISEEED